jgi:anti-anti-sigma regulatory factor
LTLHCIPALDGFIDTRSLFRLSGLRIALPLTGGDAAIFRIQEVNGRSRCLVIIEGKLTGDYVQVAEACCLHVQSRRKPLVVFLKDVTAIDEAGQKLLCRLASHGVSVRASGIYTSYVVRQVLRACRTDT